jgi:pyruvate-ferredoxin/flavodoxin oxidoreductase
MISIGFRSFALGVHHLDELEMGEDPDVRPPGAFSLRGHSIGGFGSVTTNKIIATVAAELFHLNVQAFARYGSEKKGLPTNYYLTLAPEPVRLHAELTTVDFVAVQNPQAFAVSNPLEGLAEGGIIYLQSSEKLEKIWQSLPAAARRTILERRLKLYALDAARIAKETTKRGDLQTRMQGIALLGAFLRLAPFREQAELTENELFESLDRVLAKYFGKQGKQVIAENLAVARRGYREVAEVLSGEIRGETSNGKTAWHWESAADSAAGMLIPPGYCDRLVFAYTLGREADVEADEFAARSLMPASSAAKHSVISNCAC